MSSIDFRIPIPATFVRCLIPYRIGSETHLFYVLYYAYCMFYIIQVDPLNVRHSSFHKTLMFL